MSKRIVWCYVLLTVISIGNLRSCRWFDKRNCYAQPPARTVDGNADSKAITIFIQVPLQDKGKTETHYVMRHHSGSDDTPNDPKNWGPWFRYEKKRGTDPRTGRARDEYHLIEKYKYDEHQTAALDKAFITGGKWRRFVMK